MTKRLVIFAVCVFGYENATAGQVAAADTVKKDTINIWVPTMLSGLNVSQIAFTNWTQGYSYSTSTPVLIADFFDPGYVTQSLGFSYSKLSFMTTRLGLAAQEIFVNKYRQYTDGVKAFTIQAGLESVTQAKLQVADNLLFTSGLGSSQGSTAWMFGTSGGTM